MSWRSVPEPNQVAGLGLGTAGTVSVGRNEH
ncbi:PEP-CTERM sorting domain-containing protein [Paeniglutamicibacter kerguelensis]